MERVLRTLSKKLFIILIFSFMGPTVFAKRKVQYIPQRIIFFENTANSNQYHGYVNYLIDTVCESLDSKLDVRYMKREEYDKYQYLLHDMSTDNLRKFYSKTNARGIITASSKEKNNKIDIMLTLYLLYNDKVIVKDIEINKPNFYTQMKQFPAYVTDLIKKNFPKIEPKVLTKDKLRLVKLIRNAPDYALNIWGGLGYRGKNFAAWVHVTDPTNSANEISDKKDAVINGISIEAGIEAKIKRFYVGASLGFTPYIASGLTPPEIATHLSGSGIFWFDLIGNVDLGLYFVGDLLRINLACNIGVTSNYSFYSDFNDIYNNSHILETVFYGLNIIPLVGITVKPLPTIEFSVYGGGGLQWIRYDVLYITPLMHVYVNTKFNLTKRMYLAFNFFIEMSVNQEKPLMKNEYDAWANRIYNKYEYSVRTSGVSVAIGYRFEKRVKK